MNNENRCFCELAPLYALHLLTEEERAWVEQQAAASPELTAELAELQATVGAISYSAPIVPVPADLRDRLFERLSQSPSIPEAELSPSDARQHSAEVRRSISNRTNYWRSLWQQRSAIAKPAFLGVATLGLLILAVENYRLRQTVQANQSVIETLQQPNTNFYALRGTEKAENASGKVLIDPGQNALVVFVRNLPDLPAGQAYRLWAIPQGSTKPNYCGQFSSREAATGYRSSLQAACGTPAAQLLITAESSVAPPIPAGSLVMKSSL
ncbi:MAG: anti-sigma factor [Plectolyngbya sp. WJT66-NPBG17]|jgi:anti-sigma-K factor RskA|nr:anti-sigma factor [Plectolyngbya sp. WJT66-NPBG17]MBW4527400.1 anti-sigma factor [Phormidium tanganyikae FI6-MK23]